MVLKGDREICLQGDGGKENLEKTEEKWTSKLAKTIFSSQLSLTSSGIEAEQQEKSWDVAGDHAFILGTNKDRRGARKYSRNLRKTSEAGK